MKAAVCEKPGATWQVKEIEVPRFGPNDVLIKIRARGSIIRREEGRWSQNKENEMWIFLQVYNKK